MSFTGPELTFDPACLLVDPFGVQSRDPEISPDQSLSEMVDFRLQSGGVSRDDLEQLKADIHTCINDALFRKLHDIEQVSPTE